VSFVGVSGVRHSVEVEGESLYEAVVLAVKRFRQEVWVEQLGKSTQLEVDIREPSTKHSLTLQQVERWLASAANPHDASRKAKLKTMLVKG